MRIPARLAAASVAAALPLLAFVGTAEAVRQSPTVKASQLPSVAEVSAAFPDLAGGSRSVLRAPQEDASGLGKCGNWRTVLNAPVGRWSYYTPGGNSSFFDGLDDPTVFSYKYPTVAKARKAMKRLRTWRRDCTGRHIEDGIVWTIRPRSVPRVGRQTIAYAEFSTSPNSISGTNSSGERTIAARKGRYLTISIVAAEDRIPGKRAATRLARISLAALR